MKYTLGITYSTFFEEVSGELEQLFKEKCNKVFGATSVTIDEVNEEDRHVAGNMNITLPKPKNKNNSIILFVEEFISKHSLGGECWSLSDEKGQVLITEEIIEFQ
jgi:hypothetical protein